MSGPGWFAAVVVAITVACTLSACQTYRDCRNHYKLSRAFCASALVP